MTADRDKRLDELARTVHGTAFDWVLSAKDDAASGYEEVNAFCRALAALLAAAKDVTK